ncbi:MAG: 16S rRNA (guanine(527)-N(7))-methyltransferase RsmG [Alsobacter sp.]
MTRQGSSGAADRVAARALLTVSRETEGLLERYVALLERWQRIKNLVGPGTLDSVWTRHVADSAQLADLAPDATTWLDIGSGAGFPGLVVAILLRDRPGFQMHLVESNGRKCAFLREVARNLALPVTVHDGRIEAVLPKLGTPVDVVSARALASLSELIRLTETLLTTGTLGLFPKGQDVGDELTEASKYWRIQASMVASRTDPKARIVVVTQVSRTVGS